MLAKERLAYIVNRLKTRPSISISELSKEMDVSFSTVKRDLCKLENEGMIERSRGGAISNEVSEILSVNNDIAVSEKISLNKNEKDVICKYASELIKDGECIFLDTGTTVAYIVPYIMNKQITIVTNSMYLQKQLYGCAGQVYLLGGKYSDKYDMTMGSATLMQLNSLSFDRAFISANGVNLKNKEVYSSQSEIAEIKKLALTRCKHSYLMVDRSKFDIKAIHTFAKTNDFELIFTDDYPNKNKLLNNIKICK